jgi:hypothetical protein
MKSYNVKKEKFGKDQYNKKAGSFIMKRLLFFTIE